MWVLLRPPRFGAVKVGNRLRIFPTLLQRMKSVPFGGRCPLAATRYPRVIVAIESHQGAIDMQVTTIGLDIAKNVFQIHGIDAAEKVVVRKQLRRSQVLEFFKALPPCLIGALVVQP